MPLDDIAAEGDRRSTLEALRDLIAGSLLVSEVGNVAALAKQLRETLAELDGLSDVAEGDALDELAKRRGPAPVQERPGGAGKRRSSGG